MPSNGIHPLAQFYQSSIFRQSPLFAMPLRVDVRDREDFNPNPDIQEGCHKLKVAHSETGKWTNIKYEAVSMEITTERRLTMPSIFF